MPLVRVRHWGLLTVELRRVVKALPELVSEALTLPDTPSGKLTPPDIEVFVENGNPLDIHGPNNLQDFAVTVEAMHFPERAEKIQEATDKIQKGLERITRASGFVWVTLPAAAGFAEIYPDPKKRAT